MGRSLDYDYIQKWALEKQLTAIWQEIQRDIDLRNMSTPGDL
jgi:hypothetical protein